MSPVEEEFLGRVFLRNLISETVNKRLANKKKRKKK